MKTLFVLRVNNYRPELCEHTIPTIKHWCKLNSWEYVEISKRVFPDMPVTAEKLQIYNLGKTSQWNCICDADLMLRPDFIDPTTWSEPNIVRSSYSFKASSKFVINKYFERSGRDIGISGGFVVASKLCHDLWEHPKSWINALAQTHNKHLIDEFVISNNLAKYGLYYDGVSHEPDRYLCHFGSELDNAFAVAKAQQLSLTWKTLWPSIGNHGHEPS